MLVLKNGLLIDGNGGEPVKNATVVVEGNRIANVGIGVSYPEGATVIDVKGQTIMPGLIDVHIHAGGTVELKPNKPTYGGADLTTDFADARDSAIKYGVTTIRSGGDYFPDIKNVADDVESGKLIGPRMYFHGPTFTAPGGHPAYTIMRGDPVHLEYSMRLVDDPQKAREEVKKLIDEGVGYIKVVLGDLDLWNYPRRVAKISLEVLEAIADEAHKYDKRISVHCESPQDVLDAANIGADSVEHIFVNGSSPEVISDELIKTLLDKGTYVVPTLTIATTYSGRNPEAPVMVGALKAAVKKLYDAGVKIVTGTDSGAPSIYFGKALHQEMQIMGELGMPTKDVIMAATKYAAMSMGLEKDIGTIEKGKLADLIIVSGNPFKNIADAENISLVIKDGRIMLDKIIA